MTSLLPLYTVSFLKDHSTFDSGIHSTLHCIIAVLFSTISLPSITARCVIPGLSKTRKKQNISSCSQIAYWHQLYETDIICPFRYVIYSLSFHHGTYLKYLQIFVLSKTRKKQNISSCSQIASHHVICVFSINW
jgi:hypothetical protein